MKITVDLSKYPAFLELNDPEQAVLSILDTQHSIFQSQRSAIPTTHLKDMMAVIQTATTASTGEIRGTNDSLRSTVASMSGVGDRVRHAAVEMQSTSELVRTNVSSLTTLGELMKAAVSDFQGVKESLRQLPVLLSKSQSKGGVGEACSTDFLQDALTPFDYTVEQVSTAARSGDIRVTRRDFECILDSKFYKKAVPKSEVDKLKRDMVAKKVQCGVLLSLTSGVAGYSAVDLDVYMDEEEKMACILVLANATAAPDRVVVGVRVLEAIWETFLKKSSAPNGPASRMIRDKSVAVLASVLESADDLRDLTRQFERHRKTVSDGLASFHELLVKSIERHAARVQEKLATFTEA